MNNYLVYGLLALLLNSCGSSNDKGKNTIGIGSTSQDPPSTSASLKCSGITDKALCTKAKGDDGQSLGCAINIFTDKCVDGKLKDKVERGQCGDVSLAKCGNKSKVQIAEIHNGNVKIVGMCAANIAGNKCEEAIITDPHKPLGCFPTKNHSLLLQALEDICRNYQEEGGTDVGRKTLTPGNRCDSLFLDSFGSGSAIYNVCQRMTGTKICVSYLSRSAERQNLVDGNNATKAFCGFSVYGKKRLAARADFSEVIEIDDLSACGTKPFHMYEMTGSGVKGLETFGQQNSVCEVRELDKI